jgi:hypothetical protein
MRGTESGAPAHILYYRPIRPGLVEIVRILHELMDPPASSQGVKARWIMPAAGSPLGWRPDLRRPQSPVSPPRRFRTLVAVAGCGTDRPIPVIGLKYPTGNKAGAYYPRWRRVRFRIGSLTAVIPNPFRAASRGSPEDDPLDQVDRTDPRTGSVAAGVLAGQAAARFPFHTRSATCGAINDAGCVIKLATSRNRVANTASRWPAR